jgi:alkylhydroperoxidase/carboxymuconolactone decarboxylase family protein YurZ
MTARAFVLKPNMANEGDEIVITFERQPILDDDTRDWLGFYVLLTDGRVEQILSHTPTPLRNEWPGLDEWLAFLTKCMAGKPNGTR